MSAPVPGLLEPIRAHPASSAILLDFDGTLSHIVEDPAAARPVEGVPQLLGALAARYRVVAVVSGRPAEFLAEHLRSAVGVRLIGMYGLEEVGRPSGPSIDPATLERWRPVMADLATIAEQEAPPGAWVEHKPLGFTLHYRGAPEAEGWARGFADRQRHAGIVVQPGRMAVELRPGIDADKGTVVRALAGPCRAACCFGDDLGDLAAFDALGELAGRGVHVARIAVRDDESPSAVTDAADLVVEGPDGAIELIRALAEPEDA